MKPLLDRIAADLKPSARLADCRRDLAEADREHEKALAEMAAHRERAESPATADQEAKVARDAADDAEFYARRLSRGIASLREAIATKEADESYEQRRQAFITAESARNMLVDRWREVPELLERLVTLFADTRANDAQLAEVNQQRPNGADRLLSAEIVARGALNSEFWPSRDPLFRYTKLELQEFDGPHRLWPPREPSPGVMMASDMHAALIRGREVNSPEAIAARAAAEEARWTRYEVTQQPYRGTRVPIRHRSGTAGIGYEPAFLWMDERQLQAAKMAGMTVEAAPLLEKATT